MPTTDSNGVVQLTTTDPVVPLQSTINSVSGSISSVLGDLRKDIIYKATNKTTATTKKNALAAQGIVGTAASPLLFYFTDIDCLYEWNGSTWVQIAPKPNTIVINGVEYQESGRSYRTFSCNTATGSLYYGSTQLSLPAAAPSGYGYAISVGDGGGSNRWISRVESAASATPTIHVCSATPQATVSMYISWRLQSIAS